LSQLNKNSELSHTKCGGAPLLLDRLRNVSAGS